MKSLTDLIKSRIRFGNNPPALSQPQQLLKRCLDSYPPTPIVHKGLATQLTEQQARENLTAYIDSVPTRLKSLQNCLSASGVEFPEQLTLKESRSAIVDIHGWAGETWPVFGMAIGNDALDRWQAGERVGKCAIFSVITDVATLLGEIILHTRPTLHWGVDLDPDNLREGMPSARRVVLTAPWRNEKTDSVVVDVEYVVAHRALNTPTAIDQYDNQWLSVVEGACKGGYEGVGVIDL